MDPHELQQLQKEQELHLDSLTIGKDKDADPITLLTMTLDKKSLHRLEAFKKSTAGAQMEIIKDVQQFIPPFRATLRPHDNPTLFADWSWRRQAREAAKYRSCMFSYSSNL